MPNNEDTAALEDFGRASIEAVNKRIDELETQIPGLPTYGKGNRIPLVVNSDNSFHPVASPRMRTVYNAAPESQAEADLRASAEEWVKNR